MKKKGILALGLTVALSFGLLAGCGSSQTTETSSTEAESVSTTEATEGTDAAETEAEGDGETRVIKLGLTGVIYEEIWNPIKEQLATEGIDLEYVQFSDYSLPNEALNSGDIDINAFQHHAYFNNDVEKNGYDITPIADTFIIAMNLYSEKVSSVDELQDGDIVAIPDDASNGGRALKVLESAGLIDINEAAGNNPTVADIENYNVAIEITEVGAANIPALLPDVAAAVINGNYALDYGIDPETAIYHETEYADDSYFCLIAVRSDEVDDPDFARIVELFQSEETKQIFQDTFGGYFVPAWEVAQ
jgi:D-methionine transport system substrate-binding protein